MEKIKKDIEVLHTNYSKNIFKQKVILKNVYQPYPKLDKCTYITENNTTIHIADKLYMPTSGGSKYWKSLNLYSFS